MPATASSEGPIPADTILVMNNRDSVAWERATALNGDRSVRAIASPLSLSSIAIEE